MLLGACGLDDDPALGAQASELKGGTVVPVGELEAVVRIPGCTATLVTDTAVLTAAHCVCNDAVPAVCGTTTTVTFENVFGVYDDPATSFDERTTRSNRTITATVKPHPHFSEFGWNTNDYAVLRLDRHASDEVAVAPVQVEVDRPAIGDVHTLVGYGRSGASCETAYGTKRRGALALDDIYEAPDHYDDPRAGATLFFVDNTVMTCPGDSGGPVINADNHVAGVASVGVNAGNAAYDATFAATDWIADEACPYFEPGRAPSEFCNDALCPCAPAEGDCDATSQCELGSSCFNDIGSAVGLPAHYDVCWGNDHVVTAYRDGSYGGTSQGFPAGTWAGAALSVVGDNTISSVRVKPGYLARLCDTATGGTCTTLTASRSTLGSFDNLASHLRVLPAVTLYQNVGFGGVAQTLGEGTHGSTVLAAGVGNDSASALIAAPGLNIRVCSENGAWGTCKEYWGRVSDLGSPLNATTSSVQVRPGATVYRHIDFAGTAQAFPVGTFTSTAMTSVGNDTISSLVVAPGYQATVCAHASGAAPCQTYTGWVSFVGPAMNDRASWLRISPL